MTIKEALEGVLDGLSFSENALAKVLADQSISATEDYTAAQAKSIDLAAVELLLVAYTQPDVQEGGYSIKHPDHNKIHARLLYLARKHNLQPILAQFDPKPTVNSRPVW